MAEQRHEACRHDSALSDEERLTLNKRLKRIEGQVRGLQKMVDDDRYCPDILMQMSSVSRALRSAGLLLLKTHLRGCVGDAVRSEDERRAEQVCDELIELFRKYPS